MNYPPFDRAAYNNAIDYAMVEIIRLRAKMMDAEVSQRDIQKAILAERDACAAVADTMAREIDNTNNIASHIAQSIRARARP